jgi:peptide/nickel transport system substrate-binding protein
VESTGDGFMVLFDSARGAVSCAMEIQRELAAREDGIMVRIGLNAGEILEGDRNLFGAAINLTKRVMDRADGGQVLVTDAVRQLVGTVPGARFRDRGRVALKGFPERQHLYEVRPVEAAAPSRSQRAGRRAAPGTAARRRSRAPRLIIAAGVVLVLGLAAFAVSRWGGPHRLSRIDANAVGVIDPDGRITSQDAVGRAPTALATGGGSVWVANGHDGTVSRIDAEHNATVIPVVDEPAGLAFAAGALWVTSRRSRYVLQVSPATNRVAGRVAVGNGSNGIAAGSGSVWVASEIDRTVSRIDPARGKVSRVVHLGASPTAVTAGGDAVWVTSEEAGTVFRIDPRTGAVTATRQVGNAPVAIATGEGAVWVVNRQDATVWRIDPATNAVTDSVRVGSEPSAVAVGDGAVWVANGGAGTVSRIDPATLQVTKTIAVGSRPVALGVDGGSLWTAAAPAGHRGGTLRVALAGLCCLDPGTYAWGVQWLTYDGLVAYRRSGGSQFGAVTPDLATEVPQPSPDGRTYVFTLRRGVRYSDGRLVRPEDFRASLEHLLRRHGRAIPAYYDRVVGAPACITHPARCDLSKGIETDAAAGTITVHLSEPDSGFLDVLALPFAYIVPADEPFGPKSVPPGTGPYRIVRFEEDKGARLVRNARFRVWSPDARPDGLADEIVIRVLPDAAQIADLRRGTTDVARVADQFGTSLSRSRIDALTAEFAGRGFTSAAPALSYMFMNVRTPPFDDARVRRALNYALDRRTIGKLAGGPNVADPTCQVVPPGFRGYTPSCRYTLDPGRAGYWSAPDLETARRLVDRSGTDGMRVAVWGHSEKRRIIRYVATLLDQLGYRGSARVFSDWDAYQTTLRATRGVQMGVNGWSADGGAPATYAATFVCAPGRSGSVNLSHFCDQRIQAQIAGAVAARDRADADARWRVVFRSLDDAAPVLPLVNTRTLTLVSKRVGNYQDHPLWGPMLDQISVR